MENQPVATQEPIVLTGGDAPASFDELDQLTSQKKSEPKEPEDKPAEKPSKKQKEKKEPEADKPEQSQKENDTDAPPKAEVEKPEQVVKTLKVKNGESELDVRLDSKVPVKVAGKTEMVPLQEVINGYSGQSHLDRQFATFKKERDEFTAQQSNLTEALGKAVDLLTNKKDLRGFIEYVAEAQGLDPKKTYSEMMGQFEEQLGQYAVMSPEEREAHRVKEELDHYRRRDEEARQTKAQRREQEQRQAELKQILDTHSMDIDTFENRYKSLVETGSIKPEEITPALVASYHKNLVIAETVESKIKEIAPDLENQAEQITKLAKTCMSIGATTEEIEEAVKILYENQAERKLSKKIEKMERKPKAEMPTRDPQKDPMFFSDLE